jgi:parvulin-like peptidyl-prolyl isomerase
LKKAIVLITALLLLASFGCTKREDLVVAKVGIKEITVADVEAASETMEDEYLPLTDDLEGKKELLNHLINKEIMALKADAAGYEHEEWFVKFWNKYRMPFLVTNMMDQFIVKKVEVTEEEVDKYYEEMQYEYTLSQIVVPEEDQALGLREEILAGADFAEMARRYSLGAGADRGGAVGASPIGKIHYWVEEALFEMEEGDVSMPLRTSSGYAIIKVHKKRKIIPDLDKNYARNRVRAIKEKKGIDQFKEKIEKDIELQFSTEAITVAYNALPEDVPFEDIVTYRITRSNAPKVEIPEQYREMIVCSWVDGQYTLADFEEIYETLALPERPRRQYGRENIVQTMHKRVFDQILPVYAEVEMKVLDIPEVAQALEERKEQFLVHRLYQDQIRDELGVTEREIEAYYNENKEQIMTQEQRDFAICLVSDPNVAREVMIRAKGGQDFEKLVLEFSEDETAKQNKGRTGMTAPGHYPDYDDAAFSLEGVGAVSDPVKVSRGWAVIKIMDAVEGRTPTKEEAAKAIRQQLLEQKSEELLMEKLAAWREDYVVEIYEDKLDKVELKRTRL